MNTSEKLFFIFSCFEFQFTEAGSSEDKHRARYLHPEQLLAEESSGDKQCRERVDIAHERDRLSGKLLQRGKVQIIRKPRVHKADGKHPYDILRGGDDGQLHV